jgi:hypothetical protein
LRCPFIRVIIYVLIKGNIVLKFFFERKFNLVDCWAFIVATSVLKATDTWYLNGIFWFLALFVGSFISRTGEILLEKSKP